ncbi:MAG: hypothetical protein FWC45_03535 [Treponema sp.]|nr:hypothetical protein [Treponema sp.]
MADKNVLQHLLNMEADAAAMVNDAQAEADRKIAEGEKQNRARYDEVYAREAGALEASYAKSLAAIKEDCQKQLEAYRESLKAQALNTKAFSSLTEKLLLAREL